ncbi:MAG: hypothetical protein JW395_1349 [Nitrospira sp.]|nr:hypothetical protein [Nitrospira sp.]
MLCQQSGNLYGFPFKYYKPDIFAQPLLHKTFQ